MYQKALLLTAALCLYIMGEAQQRVDSTVALEEVRVQGFETNKSIREVAASISVLGKTALQGLSNQSLLPAFNQLAGVRMEERSPGSYRLSIRGSLLRSPFGVRNIKIYLDDFIFTDAGGNTYLNLLDNQGIGRAEVIKGPAGSLYGGGTGGAVLFSSSELLPDHVVDSSGWRISLNGGSFGSIGEQIQFHKKSKGVSTNLIQSHYQSDGYRQQSRMRKDNLQWRMKLASSDKSHTDLIVLFSDLEYQTPGGLTLAQFNSNPRQARPATAILPSAIDQRTAIYNTTIFSGISNTYHLSPRWTTVSALTAAATRFRNPFITNYEQRAESNIGIRTKFVYEGTGKLPLQWVTGVEAQQGRYRIDSSGNNKGVSDGNKVTDQVKASQHFVFTQLAIQPLTFARLQGGVSVNGFEYALERTVGLPKNGNVVLPFKTQLLPRLAIMITPTKQLGLYAQFSKGYSSPTIAEIRPSAGGIYSGLQAEYGWNREAGLKLNLFHSRLQWNTVFFDFDLKNAIVRQNNASGAEYFVNTGHVSQKGIESEIQAILRNKPQAKLFSFIRLSQSYTQNKFFFKEYKINTSVYSGNRLTGVPDEIFSFNAHSNVTKRLEWDLGFYYAGRIPLNDANGFFSEAYRLWQTRFSLLPLKKKYGMTWHILIDNIGNAKYSLGNDINAFGNRFFNLAPARSVQAGVSWRL